MAETWRVKEDDEPALEEGRGFPHYAERMAERARKRTKAKATPIVPLEKRGKRYHVREEEATKGDVAGVQKPYGAQPAESYVTGATFSEAIANTYEGTEEVVNGETVTVIEIPQQLQFDPDYLPWEKQPGESDRSWHCFQIFRGLPPGDRTFVAVARKLNPTEDNHVTPTYTLQQWADYNRWIERARLYDSYLAKRIEEELVKERVQARKETAALGRSIRMKAAEALGVLNATIYQTLTDPTTGEQTQVLRSSLTPSEIARLAETGMKLERAALDLDRSEPDGTLREDLSLPNVTLNYFASGAGAEQRALRDAEEIIKLQQQQATAVDRLAIGSGGVPAEGGEVVEGEYE